MHTVSTTVIVRLISLLLLASTYGGAVPPMGHAQTTTLYQSVEQALGYSPQLQALSRGREAFGYEVKQARGRYRPAVDLLLGYGLERHSDRTTRLPEADPSDTDWDPRGDATLRLTQKVYDGGETRQQISIQKALLESSDFSLQEASQAIALNAISAHLEVYRQRKLVALAEKDLNVHEDIYQALSEIEQAGAGNIADVTQTQSRLAQARSVVDVSKGDLSGAISNYERVVGVKPGQLTFADLPETLPESLEAAINGMENKNPGLMAVSANVAEAEARVDLARSAYKPKLNVELNSVYYDQLEGDPSWQFTNDAMLVLRWNLFNGGQDKQAVNAALSRMYASRSTRDDKLIELREATATAWAAYLSLQRQKKAFHEAVTSSKETFFAYLTQFSVSDRSLLDVLNVEREYFQSARQLVSVRVNEIITAYRILSLMGTLQVSPSSGEGVDTEDLDQLDQAIEFPDVMPSTSASSQMAIAYGPADSEQPSTVTPTRHLAKKAHEPISSPLPIPLFSIEIGPASNPGVLAQAIDMLHDQGVDVRQASRPRAMKVTRLLEGLYSKDEAYPRLEEIKTVADAFVLPQGDKLAIYVGSFGTIDRAKRHAKVLAEKDIIVTPVTMDIERQESLLIVEDVDRQTAETISSQMSELGLNTKVIKSE